MVSEHTGKIHCAFPSFNLPYRNENRTCTALVLPTSTSLENTIDDSASVAAYDRDKPIFTYANGDYFISNSSSSVDHCTSSRDTTATNVENAMRHLPSHNLHSKTTLDSSAAILHDRLSRDGSYKFMHIMAAVDCDEDK